jgi:AcrR family transcriptional regulator
VDTIEKTGSIRQTTAVLERRRKILAAAILLFQRKGITGTTADEIAAEAGVTKRTLYRHVGSKENLLLAIHEDFINKGLKGWREIQASDGTATERLRRLIVAHVEIVADELPSIRIFFEEMKHLSEENQARIILRRNEYEAILTGTLREGMETGEFRVSDIRITSLALLGCLTEVYRWYQPDGPMDKNELSEFIATFVMEGLGTPSESVSV